MINFKQRDDVVPSTLILLSILVLLGALIYMVFVPAPTVAGLGRSNDNAQQTLESQIKEAKIQTRQSKEAIAPRIWKGGEDTVGAAVLSLVEQQAKKNSLTVAAFRPQREQDLNGITELPFTVQVSGSYSGIHALMESMDSPKSKVVLEQAQIASSAANMPGVVNGVTTTLGLAAYIASTPAGASANGGNHA